MNKLIPHFLAGAIAVGAFTSAGCAVGVAAEPAYADATVVGPELAYVSPGVWVVQDYHYPVFYHSNYYWMYQGGVWYRSSTYNGGWLRGYSVPVGIRRVRNPRRYVRYRAPRGTRTWRPRTRDHRHNRGYQRDNRTYRRDNRTYRRDNRRDNRTYRRDNRVERRDHRRDNRVQRRDNRRDNRRDKRDDRRRTRDHR